MKIINPLALYIHIPFCQRKCLYCDFTSFPGQREQFAAYLRALTQEIEQRLPSGLTITSLYIGGGTPTILPTEALTNLLATVKSKAWVLPEAEVTVEANPSSVTETELALLREAGVNRLSLGAQSGQDRFLQTLGRGHTTRQVETTLAAARNAGFTNINLDLIFGLPGESVDDWRETLQWATALRPEHLSCYGLQVEAGTPLAQRLEAGELNLPGEEETSAMFLLNTEFLPEAGYQQYEISNFARRPTAEGGDYRSRHNLTYWRYADYLGLGLAAYSGMAGRRWVNYADLEQYIDALRCGRLPVAEEEAIPPSTGMAEMIMLGLRLTTGPDPVVFQNRWGVSLEETIGERAVSLVAGGFLVKEAGTYRLTPRGMLVSNLVITELVAPLLR
ncbi:MAG: radical SAM family heme chaperone HemW [Firmicutes bacterium]|nr:radical SAM family heme chaperone HemW [Bacillota bacterium]